MAMNSEFKDYAVAQSDGLNRMHAHMTHYTPSTIYLVVRTDI